ncbi:UNVERIFIED_CONTAM: hypothetical protein H355_011909, partial [Colinus virginianus]
KVLMKLRKPRITATIWSSGKVICTGATSEEEAKFGARRLARCLQKLGFQVIFTDFKVVNVLAVCNMPFEIRLPEFTKNNRPHASYEPELHPAVCYRIKTLRATLQIFSTGSITVTAFLAKRKSCRQCCGADLPIRVRKQKINFVIHHLMVRFPNRAPLKTAAHWTKSKKENWTNYSRGIQTYFLVHGHSINSSPFGFYS